jgi:hypothetical protein
VVQFVNGNFPATVICASHRILHRLGRLKVGLVLCLRARRILGLRGVRIVNNPLAKPYNYRDRDASRDQQSNYTSVH